jgi:hypothetical protein
MRTSAATKSSPSLATLNRVSPCLEQAVELLERVRSSMGSSCTFWQFITALHTVLSTVCLCYLVAETVSRPGAAVNYDQLLYYTPLGLTKLPYLPLERDLTRYGVEPNPGPPKKGRVVEVVALKASHPRRKKKMAVKVSLPTPRTMRGIKGRGGYGEDIGSKMVVGSVTRLSPLSSQSRVLVTILSGLTLLLMVGPPRSLLQGPTVPSCVTVSLLDLYPPRVQVLILLPIRLTPNLPSSLGSQR